MSQIWLDVTTILDWDRAAVGIVRVEAECASHALAADGETVRFCRFAPRSGYRSVDPVDVRTALDRIRSRQATLERKPSKERHFKALLRRLIELLPGKLRASALESARAHTEVYASVVDCYRNLRRAINLLVSPARRIDSTTRPSPRMGDLLKRKVALFGPNDVYVSLGLDWDTKDLECLYTQKRDIGFKVLGICYDIIPVKLPHLFAANASTKFACYFPNMTLCADEVLCISECTRKDLRDFLSELGAPIPAMSVLKLGCQLSVSGSHPVADDVAQVLSHRYIMFVSTIERRKNHETLYRAYARLVDLGETGLPLLVFVGTRGWGVNDFLQDLRFDPRTKNLIKILDHVSDSNLKALYENSLFTVYPSLYEGWGLPVAESLAAGKFCLASNIPSILELGRDLIEYIDPWDVPLWASRLRWYFKHPDDLAQREQRIRVEYTPTPWSETAAGVFCAASRLQNVIRISVSRFDPK
jgi:glycosyltransferase involved in cell wall biosynthesis